MEISTFNCKENNCSLKLFNFDQQNIQTKLKAIFVSYKDETDHPVIASFKSIPNSVFKDGKMQHLEDFNFCPGIAETKVLPLLSNFGNVNFACIMFLIEMVNEEVIYRSRRCSMVSSGDLCKYCKETFQDLKLDMTEPNGKAEESENIPKEECFSDYEENNTDVTCEQVLEEDLMDNGKEELFEETSDGDSNVKLETKGIGVTKKKRRKIKCGYCVRSYNTSDAYLKHAKKRHSQHPDLSITLQNYIDQEKALDRRKKHTCPQCPKKYASKDTLLKHVKKAHAPEVAQSMVKHCPFCDSTFQLNKGSNHNLYTHIKNLHDNMQESSQYQDIVAEYMETKIVCPICGNFYSNNRSLATHVETMHAPAEFAPCDVCGKSIRQTTTSINSHMMIHKGEVFICPECGSSFAKKNYLQRHMLRHNDTPFPCPECGRLFTTIMKLSRHKKIVHLKERNFHCEYCEKRFPDNTKLKIHIRSVHTKEKPFACEMCQFKCARIDNLNLHRRKSHGVSKYITQLELKELVDKGCHHFVNNVE